MHIADGVLSGPVLLGGGVVAVAALAYGVRRIDPERLPHVALMSAAFFVASLIHVPIGPTSAHLILSGLVGLMLGWAAVPAVFTGLVLQCALFGFGGITSLGVNLVILAGPAVLVHLLVGPLLRRSRRADLQAALGAVAGGGAIVFGSLLAATALGASHEAFLPAARLLVLAHIPVAVVEAILTASVVCFMLKVKPDALQVVPS